MKWVFFAVAFSLQAQSILALRLGIGTTCSFDETIILYQRQPSKRIGWLNHGDMKDGVGYVFSAFKIGPKDA